MRTEWQINELSRRISFFFLKNLNCNFKNKKKEDTIDLWRIGLFTFHKK